MLIQKLNFFHRWPAMCIHGDKSQPERDWVLNGMLFQVCYFSFCSSIIFVLWYPSNYLACWTYKRVLLLYGQKNHFFSEVFVITKLMAFFDFVYCRIQERQCSYFSCYWCCFTRIRYVTMSHFVFFCKISVNDLLLLKVRVAKSTLSYDTNQNCTCYYILTLPFFNPIVGLF